MKKIRLRITVEQKHLWQISRIENAAALAVDADRSGGFSATNDAEIVRLPKVHRKRRILKTFLTEFAEWLVRRG